MPKPKPITIGERHFKSKNALMTFCSEMLAGYELEEEVSDDDNEFLLELLERHPDFEQKRGAGVSHFVVDREPEFGGRCFYLYRLDGSSTDLSYRKCVTGTSNHKSEVREAFRAAIREQIDEVREVALAREPCQCPVSGTLLDETNCKVTHVPPLTFRALVDAFLLGQGIDIQDVEITATEDNQYVPSLIDEILETRWQEYHSMNARMALVAR